MIYPFKCSCGAYDEVYRRAADAGLPQTCTCGAEMQRVFTVPFATVEHIEGYDPGLGRYISNKAQKADTIRRINAETGQHIVEIGNEKLKIAPKKQDYSVPNEVWDKVVK